MLVSALRSGPLAAWCAAWLAGHVSLDEVVDAVRGDDAPHAVLGLDTAGPTLLHDLLVTWRHADAPVRCVLPAPGDVRGLPGPAPFRAVALEAGEAVHCGGWGAAPVVVGHGPSSAPDTVTWQVFAVDAVPPDPLAVEEAQYDLTTAIRESASALQAASVAGGSAAVTDLLRDGRRAGEHLNLPPGFPPRAVALVAQAERLQAVVDLALADPIGGAVDATGARDRSAALRPLATAVRRARASGYNALARD